LYANTNYFTSAPDFSGLSTLLYLRLDSNYFSFDAIIPNLGLPNFYYEPQLAFDAPLDTVVTVGSNYKLKMLAGGTNNVFKWTLDGTVVPAATDSTYTIHNIHRNNMGTYVCAVTNPGLPGFTITTSDQRVLAAATISGKFVADDGTTPISPGNMILLKITDTGGYDTTAIKPVAANGSYSITKVVLDDYLLAGVPDATSFPKLLVTYYNGHPFWEEADTIKLNDNAPNTNITAQVIPALPTGNGDISGTLDQDLPGGRTLKRTSVANAEVSARRAQSTGRGESVIYKIARVTFTDDAGQFVLDQLDTGTYLFNVQYPGYPMDQSSFINIHIGSKPSDREVLVEALVKDNKITVTQIHITEIESSARIDAYPNPTREKLIITSEDIAIQKCSVQLTDVTGRSIQVKTVKTPASLEMDVSALTKGFYILMIHDESGQKRYSAKVIIE
jgi:hypothetical protein